MRAFLFDIDGTLVDSSASIERVWQQVATEFGVDADRVLGACHGRRDVDVVEEFFEPGARDAVIERVNVLDTQFVNGAVPAPGARQLLATLDDGQWAAVTSGPGPSWRRGYGRRGCPYRPSSSRRTMSISANLTPRASYWPPPLWACHRRAVWSSRTLRPAWPRGRRRALWWWRSRLPIRPTS